MAPLMRLSCISLYVAIKILSTSAEVFLGRGMRSQPGGRHLVFFSLLQSPMIGQKKGSNLTPWQKTNLPKEQRVGNGLGLEECGRGGVSRSFDKGHSSSKGLLGMANKVPLVPSLLSHPRWQNNMLCDSHSLKIPGRQCVGGDPANSI